MIDSLMEEQKSRFREFIKKWTQIGLCALPANRKQAENGINISYETAGIKPPKKIVWCGSPFSQGLTRALVFSLNNSTGKKLKASVGASVRASVRASVADSVWASVRASVGDSVGDSARDSVYGQHEANWLGFYDYFREVCGLERETQKLIGLSEAAKNCGWWLPYKNICWASERHNILRRDANGRLHASDGKMALEYPDGWGVYAFHGARLPRKYGSVNSERWEPKWFLEEKNAELRRCLIQGIGYSRLCHGLNAKKIDSWREYELLRITDTDIEPILMVKMVCPSTGIIHAHRVGPEVKTAKEGITWINHGISPEEFVIER